MPKTPVIDLSTCSQCEGCVEVCPSVFRKNEAGYIEVLDLSDFAEECVEEAMKFCPAGCIYWEEEDT